MTREMLDTIYSLIAGFGDRDTADTSNMVFIAKELFKVSLPLEFRGAGRLGVAKFESARDPLYHFNRNTLSQPTEINTHSSMYW